MPRERSELNWIDGMYTSLVEQRKLHDAEALSKVARFVSAQMRRDDAPVHWYLDKNPLNFRYLNLIAALFPQAKIIHCRRHLCDTALSLWMQHFAHEDLGFSYDFSSIATFAQGYERLLMHWRETLHLPIFDLYYEALTTDTEATLALTEPVGRRLDFLMQEFNREANTLGSTAPARLHEAAAELYARCRWAGVTPRNGYDCLIAQISIEHDVALLANDRDFGALARVEPRLRIYPDGAARR